jgi:MoxR-like ATPase
MGIRGIEYDLEAIKRLPLVGRKEYLEDIYAIWKDMRQPTVLYLEGEGGVGKTALLEHVLDKLGCGAGLLPAESSISITPTTRHRKGWLKV